MSKIAFIISIHKKDWDNTIGGWRCPALKIPTSTVEAFYVKGEKVDDRQYKLTPLMP